MNDIRKNLLKYGNKERDLDALQEYVEKLKTDDLTSFLKENLHLPNGPQLLNFILAGFTETTLSHNKRFQVVLTVLKLIEEKNIPTSQSSLIVTRICLQFSKFKSEHLVQILEFCIEKIQNGNICFMCWKDVFPDVLNVLTERNCVIYNNSELSGNEFRKQIINSLCVINWSANIVTVLTEMFSDITLLKEEHLQIVTKLCQNIDKMACQEIPAFTYQLLKLCRNQNSKCVFIRLQNYFSNHIYKKLKTQNTESSDMTDLNDIEDASEKDAQEVESTVLYHIHKSASYGHSSFKEYLNSLKGLKSSPEFILHPFQLSVLLTISTISCYEEGVFEVLRQSISRSIQEDFKREDSAWFLEMAPSTMKIENVIIHLIENSLAMEIVEGLVSLGFLCLGYKVGLGPKHFAERHWELGNIILLKLMKRKRFAANAIIQQLSNHIITVQNTFQYTECLYNMARNLTLIMLENQSVIIQLIEELPQLPGGTAKLIINAIIPLIKISPSIRDNLILILRKALWCKMLETRQMSVTGFLKLLQNLRVSNLSTWSQSQNNSSSSSAHSFMTQMSIDCHTNQTGRNKINNEALCLEVLVILKRCFMLQAEVRTEFYEGLYEAVCMNLELGIPVLDLLWTHFNIYYSLDQEKLPPLIFEKIITIKNNDVILQEPIAQLIFTIGLIITKIKETENADNKTVLKFENVFNSLVDQMSQCELIHFELDDGIDLTDNLPESQLKLYVLKQAISVYEALMGYLMCSWNSTSENNGKKINNLFQGYSKLTDFLKNINRNKKSDGKKKDKNTTEKKSKQKTVSNNAIKHVLDLQIISKMLSMLYDTTVTWTTVAQTQALKIKREFHRYILNVALQIIQNLKTTKTIELKHTNVYFNYCIEIGTILYERIVQRLDNVIDFDSQTTVLALELFHNILSFILNRYKDRFNIFLCKISSKDRDIDLDELLSPFIEEYQKLLQMEENEELSEDPEGKKIPGVIVNTFCLLVMYLPKNGLTATKVLNWLKHYLNENTIGNKQIVNALIPVWFNLHIKCKSSDLKLFENIALKLCDVIGTVNTEIKTNCPYELKSINEATVLNTLTVLTNTLKTLLDEIDWIISRIRSEYTIIIFPGEDKIERKREYLKIKERELCCHIRQIISVCQTISNLGVPNGSYTEAVIKILVHLYNTLSSLTKYFMIRSSKANPAFQTARFELVVKQSGKQLNNIISDFILSIEQNQLEPEEQAKKQKDGNALKSKVLKETKLIPKLVYEIEQYSKNIIQLSNKTKVDLSKFIGTGTSRDFRIKAPDLKAALEKLNNSDPNETFVTADDEVSVNENENIEENNGDESNPDGSNVDESNVDSSNVNESNDEESMEVDQDSEKENQSDQENLPPKKKLKK